MTKRIIVGVTGASGAIYGYRMLQFLEQAEVESHLVISRSGLLTAHQEIGLKKEDWTAQAAVEYPCQDIGAACSSGSFQNEGMVIAPCSMKTLAEVANGVTTSLVSRAAEVTLKERRRLVLMVRETPLTATHLRNMSLITEMGGIICPPVPAFYTLPTSLDDIVNHTVGRVLDLFGIDNTGVKRWTGLRTGDALPE